MLAHPVGSPRTDAGYLPSDAQSVHGNGVGAPLTLGLDGGAEAGDALDRAARRVLRGYPGNALVAGDASLVRVELTAVVEGVRAALGGQSMELQPPGVDRLGLLRSLRTAIVWEWTEADGSILPVVRAIEAAQQSLLATGDGATVGDILHPYSRNLLREVAHLLRSPLGSIVMLTDTLLEGRSGPLTERQQRQLDIIHRAALGIASITGDLLTLVSEDEAYTSPVRFDLGATVEAIADVVRPVAAARDTDLVVDHSAAGSRVGPAAGIAQALLGLALRAALRTRDGSVEITVTPEGDHVRFSVNGFGTIESSGDDAADLVRVVRVDPDSGAVVLSADGLGVEAAREILERLGSELTIDVEPNEILMTFRMPLPPAGAPTP